MAVGVMDKFIYRGILTVCAIILAIVLIAMPVMTKMYMKMKKVEVMCEKILNRSEKE